MGAEHSENLIGNSEAVFILGGGLEAWPPGNCANLTSYRCFL